MDFRCVRICGGFHGIKANTGESVITGPVPDSETARLEQQLYIYVAFMSFSWS